MPRYTTQTLGPGEKILCEGHYHWFYWAKQLLFCIVVFGLSISIDVFVLPTTGLATVVAFFTCAISLTCAYIVYQNDEMVITNHRVILKTGFFARDVFEMQIQKIETVLVDQSILGRFFDYGSISCRGTGGTSSKEIVIAAPLDFRAAFQAAVKEAQNEPLHHDASNEQPALAASSHLEEQLNEIILLLHSINSKLDISRETRQTEESQLG